MQGSHQGLTGASLRSGHPHHQSSADVLLLSTQGGTMAFSQAGTPGCLLCPSSPARGNWPGVKLTCSPSLALAHGPSSPHHPLLRAALSLQTRHGCVQYPEQPPSRAHPGHRKVSAGEVMGALHLPPLPLGVVLSVLTFKPQCKVGTGPLSSRDGWGWSPGRCSLLLPSPLGEK